MHNPPPTSRRSYPLGALFVLTAACAIASAMVAPVVRDLFRSDSEPWTVVGCGIAGAFLTAGLGAVVGLYHHRRLMGMLLGGMAGGGLGLVAGLIVLAKSSDTTTILLTSLVGSIAIVAIGALVGFQSKSQQ